MFILKYSKFKGLPKFTKINIFRQFSIMSSFKLFDSFDAKLWDLLLQLSWSNSFIYNELKNITISIFNNNQNIYQTVTCI